MKKIIKKHISPYPQGIVVKNKDRLFLIANKIAKKLLDIILREVILVLRVSKYKKYRVQ